MGGAIPAWGLFRLLKGLEVRGLTGALDLETSEGPVTLGLRKGRVYQADSDVRVLGFGAFLVKARMLPDPATAERLASTRRLVDAGVIRPEDAAKLHGSYARSVLARILAGPLTRWSFRPADALEGVVSDHPVDPFPELLRAVSRDAEVEHHRAVVARLLAQGPLSLEPGSEFALSHAKAHFGEVPVVRMMRQGQVGDIDAALVADDVAARILFAMVVAGMLHASAPARPPAPPPPGPGAHPDPAPAGAAPAPAPSPLDAAEDDLPPVDEVVARPAPEVGSRRAPTASKVRPVWMQPAEPVQMAAVSNPFEKELAQAWGEMRSRNHFEVLGVPVDARESAIRTAWLKAHHVFARAKYEGVVSAEALQILDQIHAHLDTLKGILGDRNRRLAYNRQIDVHTPSLDSRIAEIFDARALWRAGTELLEARKAVEALAQFEAAARQDPGEPDYKVAQAWAILALPPGAENLKRARALAEEALKAEPDLVDAMACLASICRTEGRVDDARELVRKALVLDPEHAEAQAVRDLLKPRPTAPKMQFVKKRETLVDRLRKAVEKAVGALGDKGRR